MFFILVWNNVSQYLALKYHAKLYLSSKVKILLLSMTDTRKVIQNWTDLRMFGRACTRLVHMTNASCQNQIWKSPHQLIASWCPNKITWYKQQYMFIVLVCTCSVLPDFYDFQSYHNLLWAGYFTLGTYNDLITCTLHTVYMHACYVQMVQMWFCVCVHYWLNVMYGWIGWLFLCWLCLHAMYGSKVLNMKHPYHNMPPFYNIGRMPCDAV